MKNKLFKILPIASLMLFSGAMLVGNTQESVNADSDIVYIFDEDKIYSSGKINYSGTYTFNFTSNGESFQYIEVDDVIYFSNDSTQNYVAVYDYNWEADSAYKTITLTSEPTGSVLTMLNAYANRQASSYTISYNLNGGSGTAPTGVSDKKIGDSITLPTYTGYKKGCTFLGWSTSSSATSGNNGSYTLVDADKPTSGTNITFYAVWEELSGVYWYDNNTHVSSTSQTLPDGVVGENYDLEFYVATFPGFSSKSYGTGLEFEISTIDETGLLDYQMYGKPKNAGDFTVTVFYQDFDDTFDDLTQTFNFHVQAKVTFDSNGATSGTTPERILTDANETVTLPSNTGNLTKTGYFFGGWSTTIGGSAVTSVDVTNTNVTLYAIWDLDAQTVTYNLNGGSGTTPVDSNTYASGTEVTLTNVTPTKTGYKFVGWSTSTGENGDIFLSGSTYIMGTSDVTFYAVWANYIYTTNTDGLDHVWDLSQGGEVFSANDTIAFVDNSDTSMLKINYDNGGIPASTSVFPYEFNIVTIANNGAYVSSATNGSFIHYPEITINDYVLTYDLNGGTGTVPTHSADNGKVGSYQEITLPDSTGFSKTGYKFVGWNSDKDATTGYTGSYTLYTNTTDLITVGNNSSFKFYAIWRLSVIDEQPNSTNDYTITISDAYKNNPNISYKWYKQVGVNTPEVITSETTNQLSSDLAIENASYYCEIILNSEVIDTSETITPVLVKFEGDANMTGNAISMYQLVGRTVEMPANPFTYLLKGYQFDGWKNDDGELAVGDSYTVEEATLFKAQYTTIKHTCDHVTNATPLTSDFTGGNLSAGSYYLFEDITLTSSITFDDGAEVTIDLNGHIISASNQHANGRTVNETYPFCVFKISNNVKLTVTDCDDETVHKFSYDQDAEKPGYFAKLDDNGDISVIGGAITNVYGSIFQFTSDEGISANTESLTLSNVTIIGNHAYRNGFLYNSYGDNNGNGYRTDVSFENVHVIGNEMISPGGNVYNNTLQSMFNFGNSCVFDYNVSIKNVLFEHNYISGSQSCYGFIGIYKNNSNTEKGIVLDNVDFNNNIVYTNGCPLYAGLIYINCWSDNDYSNTDKAIKLKDCDFTNNDVSSEDNSIYGLINHNCYLIAENCSFTENAFTADHSEFYGVNGGMFHSSAPLKLSNCVIAQNTITTTRSDQYAPCGLVCASAGGYVLELDNVLVSNNTIYTEAAWTSSHGENSGYYIYSGYGLKINNLTFEKNSIVTNEYLRGTTNSGSASYSGAFIFASDSLNGDNINSDGFIDISNSTFSDNNFDDPSISVNYYYVNGGLITTRHDTRYTAVSFESNCVSTNNTIQGGLIYCSGNLQIVAKETKNGNVTTYDNSTFRSNSISTTDNKTYRLNSNFGGLIYGNSAVTIDRADLSYNTVNIDYTNYCSAYGLLIANNTDLSSEVLSVTNSTISNNDISAFDINGLIFGHFDIRNTQIEDNKLSASKFTGGILCSNSNGGTVTETSEDGVYTINNVIISNNKFNLFNSFKENAYKDTNGLFINIRSTKLTVDGLTISNNGMFDESQKFDFVHGVVICFAYNKYTGDDIDMVLENITVVSNSFNISELSGGFIYNKIKATDIRDLTFRSNTFDVDILYGGIAYTDGERFQDIDISNNVYNISDKNYGNLYCLVEQHIESDISNRQKLVFDEEITLNNNTFSKLFADAACYSDKEEEFIKIITSTSSDSLTSFTPITYYTGKVINTSELLCTNGENFYTNSYISLYEDKYYLDLVEEGNDKVIKIFNRLIEEPSSDNEYEYKINEKDTTITYEWFAACNDGDVSLEVYQNKTNLDNYLYGSFYCAAVTEDGFLYISSTTVITPTLIEAPSEDNGYKAVFDETKINLFDVDVTYAWKTMSSYKTGLYTLVDNTIASSSSGELSGVTYEGFYDSTGGYWYNSSNTVALGVQNITLNPGENIMIDVTSTYEGDEEFEIVVFPFYVPTGTTEFNFDYMMYCYCHEYLGNYVTNVPYPTELIFNELGLDEYGDPFTYSLIIFSMDNDGNYYPVNAKITVYSETDTNSYVDDENIKVFTDEDFACTYNSTTKTITQQEDAESGLVQVYLEAGDYINFNFLNNSEINWSENTCVSIYKFDKYLTSLEDTEAIVNALVFSSNSIFNSFKADEDGYYLFGFELFDYDGDNVLLNATMTLGGFDSYAKVEGQTTNELDNVSDGKYLCSATFSSETFGKIVVNTDEVDFTRRSVTYNANGQSVTVPTDSEVYKNTKDVVVLGTPNDLEVEGKNFLGWSTNADGSGTIYSIGDTLKMGKEALVLYAIYSDKTSVDINTEAQSKTYAGYYQEFEIKGNHKDIGSFTIEYKVNDVWTTTAPTNAGKYDVRITRAEDATYAAYCKEITNGLVINKATTTIDTTNVVKTYTYTGNEQVVESGAILNHSETSPVYSNNKFTNVGTGTYTVKISSAETDNYLAAETTVEITVNKMKVDEPTVAYNYVYNEIEQTLDLNNLEDYMTTNPSEFKATNAGTYIIHITLDNNHEWNEGSDGIIFWTIKADKITPNSDSPEGEENEKEQVIVESKDGFSEDITVTVVITLEAQVKTTELSVDYYNLTNEDYKLESNERIGVIYDVKLIRTVDGVDTEIQPSDIAPGATIRVKMLIPEDIDISKVTRILHVHSATDIEVIEFNPDLVDEDGYYVIEISELSEFAFVYQKSTLLPIILISVGAVLFIILVLLILFVFWKNEYDKAVKNDTLDARHLAVFDPLYKPINSLLFGKKKVKQQ